MMACAIVNEANNSIEFSITDRRFNGASLAIVGDWDMDGQNLTEEQNRKLNFSTIRGNSNEKNVPNLEEKSYINQIVNAPLGVNQLTPEEKDTIFIFRYSLTDNKRALTKLLLSIDWDVDKERAEVAKLLPLWKEKASLDVAEALKLLGKERAFQDPIVRAYAIECVNEATDEELQLYLLQLVQALKYEPKMAVGNSSMSSSISISQSSSGDRDLRQKLYKMIENGEYGDDDEEEEVEEKEEDQNDNQGGGNSNSSKRLYGKVHASVSPLAQFLITRACHSTSLANFLFWYLTVETDSDDSNLFSTVLSALMHALARYSKATAVLARQLWYLDEYLDLITACQEDARTQMAWLTFSDRYVFPLSPPY